MPVPASEYHERTKHSPESVRADTHRLVRENQPIPYKIYEDRPSVPLAGTVRPPRVPALRAIAGAARRSPGDGQPDDEDATAPDLDATTQLCWLSSGITTVLDRGGHEHAFRAAACTGALYHVDAYLVVGDHPGRDADRDWEPGGVVRPRAVVDVDPAAGSDGGDGAALDAGVYHFDPRDLTLDVLRAGDYRGTLSAATGHHPAVAHAPLSIVLTSTWWRNAWKYRERTYRHAFWDSGTVIANLLAVAHALDLPTSVVAGFADGAVAELLGVAPREEGPVAVVSVGTGAPAPDPRPVDAIDPETRPLSPDPVEYDLIGGAYAASSLPDGAAGRAWRESAAEATGPNGPIVSRAPGDGERIELDPSDVGDTPDRPLHETIRRRGSSRQYDRDALDFRTVSTVLARAIRGVPMDATAPAGAALALNDCYVIVNGVEGVASGAYQFHPGVPGTGAAGTLERLIAGEFRHEAGHLALDQRLAADAALCAFFLTDLDAVTDALGDRGYRAAQLEAAITAGRLYLAAYAHDGLGATGLTFYDDEVTAFLSPRAAGETPTFCWTLGRPA